MICEMSTLTSVGGGTGGGRIEIDRAVHCPRHLSNAIRRRICGYFDNFGGGFSKVRRVRRGGQKVLDIGGSSEIAKGEVTENFGASLDGLDGPD